MEHETGSSTEYPVVSFLVFAFLLLSSSSFDSEVVSGFYIEKKNTILLFCNIFYATL